MLVPNGLKDAAGLQQESEILLLGTTANFVKPTYRCGFKAGLCGRFCWIDNLDLYFDSILAALNPSLSFLVSFCHKP